MNKKHIKVSLLFLIFFMISFAITTVSASDTNETVSANTKPTDMNSQPITGMKTVNDNIQTSHENNGHKSFNTNTENNRTKSLEKKQRTGCADKNAIHTKLTVNTNKNVSVGTQIAITGRLSASDTNIANQQVTINACGRKFTAKTNKNGIYRILMTPKTTGTKTITSSYNGTSMYGSSKASMKIMVKKIVSKLTVSTNKTIPVGTQIAIMGKLKGNNKNLGAQQIIITVDGTKYRAKTTKEGIYRILMTPKTVGTKTITANFAGTSIYNRTSTKFKLTVNKKTSILTLACTKNVNVGDKVSIYGKLTVNGKNISSAKVKINLNHNKYYTVTTTKEGKYNLNITAPHEGHHMIFADYAGNDKIKGNSKSTYFDASKKATVLTINSVDDVVRGESFSVYGKLTSNGKNLAYKEVEVKVGGNTYHVTTSKYGKYQVNATNGGHGQQGIMATFYGDTYYSNSTAIKGLFVQNPSLELYTYQLKNGYPQSSKQIGKDLFTAWYQTYDGQYTKGVHIEIRGYNATTDTYSNPHHSMIHSIFYFKNSAGHIIEDSCEDGDDIYRYHSLISGYTPYKVFITYCDA